MAGYSIRYTCALKACWVHISILFFHSSQAVNKQQASFRACLNSCLSLHFLPTLYPPAPPRQETLIALQKHQCSTTLAQYHQHPHRSLHHLKRQQENWLQHCPINCLDMTLNILATQMSGWISNLCIFGTDRKLCVASCDCLKQMVMKSVLLIVGNYLP